ncbi:MAG: 50S ribosomal protein L19 [Patescibacteria group bacterium]|jgi:large subunit ribosomal protein L19
MAEQKNRQKTEKDAGEKEKKIIERQPLPQIKPGMTIRVHQKIKEKGAKGEKERVQIFEGIVIAIKHGQQNGGTITVRKISEGIGVEKIYPIHSPNIVKIEPVKQAKVSRAKLYYLRGYKKRVREKKIENK